jgi:hypothetical protein
VDGVFQPPGFLSADPVSGLVTLTYPLPGFAGVVGDVELLEPPPAFVANVSDIIRFPGNGMMYFFSDSGNDPPEPGDLADGPLPTAMFPNVVFNEVGAEGDNGLFGYAPGVAGIGGGPGAPTYDFISDGVLPEPAAGLFLALWAVPVLLSRRNFPI